MNLTINGEPIEASSDTTLHMLQKQYAPACDVIILNGFQTKDDLPLQDGDTVTLLQKGIFPGKDELNRLMMARHTPAVHEKVRNAAVAIAGLGGLGSNIAILLARTGIGKLLLIDFDIVEPSNLNRQSYYVRHLGMAKTDALQEQIQDINPFIQVETKTVQVTEQNITELFQGYSYVCEAFDDPAAKAVLINGLLEHLPRVKIVAASGMAGYDSANHIITSRKFRNLYLCGDMEKEARPGQGLMAPRVAVCAGHQANMLLRLLLGIEEP